MKKKEILLPALAVAAWLNCAGAVERPNPDILSIKAQMRAASAELLRRGSRELIVQGDTDSFQFRQDTAVNAAMTYLSTSEFISINHGKQRGVTSVSQVKGPNTLSCDYDQRGILDSAVLGQQQKGGIRSYSYKKTDKDRPVSPAVKLYDPERAQTDCGLLAARARKTMKFFLKLAGIKEDQQA